MKKLVAVTMFCAGLAVPAVAQGPHPSVALNAAKPSVAAQAADMVPVSGAVAAPVNTPIYGGDMATGTGGNHLLPSGPAPSFAWVLALGFLGLVVMRRTRSSAF